LDDIIRKYRGHVIGLANEDDPPLWKVRVKTPGEYLNKRVSVDRNNIPAGIYPGANVCFDLDTSGAKPLAINTALCSEAKTE
jgi:hypothetical protein